MVVNVAIIDIGSGSIGLALVALESNKVPTFKFLVRQELRLEKDLSPKKLMYRSIKTLDVMTSELYKNSRVSCAPSKIFCFLSSHLVIPQTRSVSIKFNEPTAINDKIIENIVEGELEKFRTDHARLLHKSETSGVLVEQKIMDIKLNGYPISNFKNKIASEIELSIFFTLAPSDKLSSIKNTIAKSFHNNNVEFHSFQFAYFNVLRDLFQKDSDFIFMDVGSEITDVSLAGNGIFQKAISVPLGRSSLIRRLMEQRGGESALAESSLKIYRKDDPEIDLAGANWVSAIKTIFDNLTYTKRTMVRIFILADSDASTIFRDFILRLEPRYSVTELVSTDLDKLYNNRSNQPTDQFLAMSTIFVNKLVN